MIAPLRHISVVFILGLMIPVSFSLYPQLGTVRIHESVFIAEKNINVFSVCKKLIELIRLCFCMTTLAQ